MSRILLKEIISLKNQKDVYLIQDDEGAFLYQKRLFKNIHLLFNVEEKVAINWWDWTQLKMSGKIPSNISAAKFSANDINKRDYDAYLQ